VVRDGFLEDGGQRFKCKGCGKRFCETTGSFFHKHRIPVDVVKCAIFFHLFVTAGVARVFVRYLYGCSISESAICAWSRKFLDRISEIEVEPSDGKSWPLKVRHTDEKQIKVKKETAWWLNTVDETGKPLTASIVPSRDGESVKEHMRKHKNFEKDVDIMVTDGMPSYHKSVKIFGRKCYHAVTGLEEQTFNIRKKLFFLSNLPVERLHSLIDSFIQLKVRGNFSNLEQADRTRKAFMLTQLIKKEIKLGKRSVTFPTALKEHKPLMEIAVTAKT